MKPEEPEEPYNGDPIAERILRFCRHGRLRELCECRFEEVYYGSSLADAITKFNFSSDQIANKLIERLDEIRAEDFVFLCQCGIVPDLSLD